MIGLDTDVLPSGTKLVMTPALDALLTLAPVTFEAGRIVGIDGPAGCGKTTAVTALVERLGKPAVSVSLDPRSTDKNVVALFHEAVLGQPAAPRALRTDMLASLRRALAGTEKLIGGRGQWRVEMAKLEAFIQRSYEETSRQIALDAESS